MTTLSAIPIAEPWIDLILKGFKIWEIRSKNTKKIGPVALIRSGSKTVVALAEISEVIPLTQKLAYDNAPYMGFEKFSKKEAAEWVGQYAWVLKNIIKLKTPVPYKHPNGAITWVTLDEATTKKVYDEAKKSKKVKYVEFIPE